MNNKRRAAIRKIIEEIKKLSEELTELKNEEEECYDNMPEALQDSERGEIALDHVEQLQQSASGLDGAICDLQQAVGERCAQKSDCDAIVGLLQAVCEQAIGKYVNNRQVEPSTPADDADTFDNFIGSAIIARQQRNHAQHEPETSDSGNVSRASQAKFIEEAIEQLKEAAIIAKECVV